MSRKKNKNNKDEFTYIDLDEVNERNAEDKEMSDRYRPEDYYLKTLDNKVYLNGTKIC